MHKGDNNMKRNFTKYPSKYIRSVSADVDLDSIPEENKHGDCFVSALHTFMENPRKYTLVHGVVTGQGPLEGLQYCHAWVLDGDTVIDKTTPMKKLPADLYYAIGQIEITREYNASEVYKMLDKYETYGPWDKVFNKYP